MSTSFTSANGNGGGEGGGEESGGNSNRRSRNGPPSPALFSEADRLLGGFDFGQHNSTDGGELPGPRGPRRRRTRARDIRRLLALRSETVAALREALFGPEDEDADGQVFERLPEAEDRGDGTHSPSGQEALRKARIVGDRIKDWGWQADTASGGVKLA